MVLIFAIGTTQFQISIGQRKKNKSIHKFYSI